jgi:hypothetical protein
MSSNVTSNPHLPRPRWRMLLVDDTGRLVTIQRFRALGWLFFFVLLAAVGTSAVSLLLYQRTSAQSRILHGRIEALQNQIASLREERERASLRLAVAETRIQRLSESQKPALQEAARTAAPEPESTPATDAQGEKATTAPSDSPPARVVTVEDFLVSREQGQNLLNFHYKLVNVDDKPGPVSGYSFVLLKTDSKEPGSWLSLPNAALENGRPAPVEKGRAFSIARFKTVSFSAIIEQDVDLFTSATILVFENEGKLLFEKTYPTPWSEAEGTIGEG